MFKVALTKARQALLNPSTKQRHIMNYLSCNFSTDSSSVRNKEVEFYSKLEDWWSPDGPQKQLHKFNKVRVNFIRRHLLEQRKQAGEKPHETL